VLERFPPGAKFTDGDLMQQFQQMRLRVDRLENEKRELLHQLKMSTNPDRAWEETVSLLFIIIICLLLKKEKFLFKGIIKFTLIFLPYN
jgi:hypothetical protein